MSWINKNWPGALIFVAGAAGAFGTLVASRRATKKQEVIVELGNINKDLGKKKRIDWNSNF